MHCTSLFTTRSTRSSHFANLWSLLLNKIRLCLSYLSEDSDHLLNCDTINSLSFISFLSLDTVDTSNIHTLSTWKTTLIKLFIKYCTPYITPIRPVIHSQHCIRGETLCEISVRVYKQLSIPAIPKTEKIKKIRFLKLCVILSNKNCQTSVKSSITWLL